jgi:hypothetical protein
MGFHRDWGSARSSGFDTTNLTVKGEIYRNDLHETLVSAGLGWGIGHSGAQGAGTNAPDLIAPGIFFGKGFGDLPTSSRGCGRLASPARLRLNTR